jgi:branched-chain amino acid transport system permease protein
MDIQIFAAQLINGLAIGSIYALIVVGMNLLLLVRRITHLAYPHIVVLSMYAMWLVLGATDNNLALAIPVGIVTAVVLNIATEPIFRPLARREAYLETVIVALGIGIIMTDVMSHFLNNGLAIAFPANLLGSGALVRFDVISFSLGYVYALLGGVAAVFALLYFLFHRKQGLAFRAMAQNLETARLLGIPFNRTGIQSFAIGGVLAGLTGLLVAMTIGAASPGLGESLSIKAVVLILFAGSGNLKGGLISALLMGVAEALVAAYIPGRWTDAVVFGTIMTVIIIKPQGLFGARV